MWVWSEAVMYTWKKNRNECESGTFQFFIHKAISGKPIIFMNHIDTLRFVVSLRLCWLRAVWFITSKSTKDGLGSAVDNPSTPNLSHRSRTTIFSEFYLFQNISQNTIRKCLMYPLLMSQHMRYFLVAGCYCNYSIHHLLRAFTFMVLSACGDHTDNFIKSKCHKPLDYLCLLLAHCIYDTHRDNAFPLSQQKTSYIQWAFLLSGLWIVFRLDQFPIGLWWWDRIARTKFHGDTSMTLWCDTTKVYGLRFSIYRAMNCKRPP